MSRPQVTLSCYVNTWVDNLPKFSINWMYYNCNPKQLVKRNRYRTRMGFSEILDEGCHFTLWINFGTRECSLEIIFRERRDAPSACHDT